MRQRAIMRFVFASVLICAASVQADDVAPSPVDFHNDLIPVLTKHGCNAGTCHGAAIGRGGFKLSLYGGAPPADYRAIVRELAGRRVNLVDADESLILNKPLESVEHGGGEVFVGDSESATLIRRWIEEGASEISNRKLERVTVSPAQFAFAFSTNVPTNETTNLSVTATYSDGTSRDVTRWTIFTPEDASAIDVHYDDQTELATASVHRRGRHIVVARFLDRVIPIELIVPVAASAPDVDPDASANFIDVAVADKLRTLGLVASGRADDTAFLRRITLDLTGRLPTRSDVESFLADQSREKRSVLIDRLLDSPEFTEYFTLKMAKWLRIRPTKNDVRAAEVYHDWVRRQVAAGASYRDMVVKLITSAGDTHVNGPANFYRTTQGPREQTEFISELFMGSRLRCANCHNHPLDRWTQDDYHGLAAIFAKVEGDKIIREKPYGTSIHPRTMQPAMAKLPGETEAPSGDGRQRFAQWLTNPSNPYFAKAIVNRLWNEMMGRGLVNPVDDFRSTNPATHPELLDALATDFIDNGYRLRHTIKRIAESDAYGRSDRATPNNVDDDRYYSRAVTRPLQAEVLADAISDVIGVPDQFGELAVGTRAVTLVNPMTPSPTLEVLGRCDRSEGCDGSAESGASLSQKLHLMNGELLNDRIVADGSRLDRLIKGGKDADQVIEAFYLTALSRYPTERESLHWSDQLAETSDEAEFLADFVWAILSCQEFTTNH